MYGAVSALLERVVPESPGPKTPFASTDGAFELMGVPLPPGTVVGMQAWSFHRDPIVFPHPDCFEPERWLPSPSDPEDGERLARCVLPHFRS